MWKFPNLSFLFSILISVTEGPSLDAVLRKINSGFLFDEERCDGIICDEFICVPHSVVCDKQINCQDGVDELFCPCPEGQFKCLNLSQCIPEEMICDGTEDCEDASDEHKQLCEEIEEGSGHECEGEEGSYLCDQITCINQSQRCDGVFHCQDKTDELNCDSGTENPPNDDLSFDDQNVGDVINKSNLLSLSSKSLFLSLFLNFLFKFVI
ncbi:UNVERIFIED_CONTAM: hypothetical protein RMT77_009364 [Armadillidium vulgare]